MQTPALLPGFFISLFSLSSHLPCDRISVLAAIVCVDVLLLFQLSGVALPILEALPIIFRSVNGNFSSVPATFPTALINFPGGNIYMFRQCMRVLRNMSWRLFPTKHESIPLRPLSCLRHTRIRDGLHCYLSSSFSGMAGGKAGGAVLSLGPMFPAGATWGSLIVFALPYMVNTTASVPR